ncbi:hypothetical protein JXA34_02790 [Patescibacteria group bacterium]|nr:hypothetical protein [Patescibacteria group bacterium]
MPVQESISSLASNYPGPGTPGYELVPPPLPVGDPQKEQPGVRRELPADVQGIIDATGLEVRDAEIMPTGISQTPAESREQPVSLLHRIKQQERKAMEQAKAPTEQERQALQNARLAGEAFQLVVDKWRREGVSTTWLETLRFADVQFIVDQLKEIESHGIHVNGNIRQAISEGVLNLQNSGPYYYLAETPNKAADQAEQQAQDEKPITLEQFNQTVAELKLRRQDELAAINGELAEDGVSGYDAIKSLCRNTSLKAGLELDPLVIQLSNKPELYGALKHSVEETIWNGMEKSGFLKIPDDKDGIWRRKLELGAKISRAKYTTLREQLEDADVMELPPGTQYYLAAEALGEDIRRIRETSDFGPLRQIARHALNWVHERDEFAGIDAERGVYNGEAITRIATASNMPHLFPGVAQHRIDAQKPPGVYKRAFVDIYNDGSAWQTQAEKQTRSTDPSIETTQTWAAQLQEMRQLVELTAGTPEEAIETLAQIEVLEALAFALEQVQVADMEKKIEERRAIFKQALGDGYGWFDADSAENTMNEALNRCRPPNTHNLELLFMNPADTNERGQSEILVDSETIRNRVESHFGTLYGGRESATFRELGIHLGDQFFENVPLLLNILIEGGMSPTQSEELVTYMLIQHFEAEAQSHRMGQEQMQSATIAADLGKVRGLFDEIQKEAEEGTPPEQIRAGRGMHTVLDLSEERWTQAKETIALLITKAEAANTRRCEQALEQMEEARGQIARESETPQTTEADTVNTRLSAVLERISPERLNYALGPAGWLAAREEEKIAKEQNELT